MIMAYSTIIIAGGGIIGNSIAYYLAKRGISCTIIDPVGIAPAASGKGGGFLAGIGVTDVPYKTYNVEALICMPSLRIILELILLIIEDWNAYLYLATRATSRRSRAVKSLKGLNGQT